MISRDIAETLIAYWAAEELSEILKVGHAEPGVSLIVHPRRAGGVSQASIEATGRALMSMKKRHLYDYRSIRTHFIDGAAVSRNDMNIALDRFALVYVPPSRALPV